MEKEKILVKRNKKHLWINQLNSVNVYSEELIFRINSTWVNLIREDAKSIVSYFSYKNVTKVFK